MISKSINTKKKCVHFFANIYFSLRTLIDRFIEYLIKWFLSKNHTNVQKSFKFCIDRKYKDMNWNNLRPMSICYFTTTVVTSRHATSRNKDFTSWLITSRHSSRHFIIDRTTDRTYERTIDRPTDRPLPIASAFLTKRTW